MIRNCILLIIIGLTPFFSFSQLACGQDIDLNSWIQEGSISDGKWTVSADGKSVEQSINGEPTFFVSPDTFINVIMEGKIKVNTGNDDDLVGFVFGYKNPSGIVDPAQMNVQSYVFDWKQAEQTDGGGTSKEGYALYQVDGIVDYTDYAGSSGPVFWARDNSAVSTIMATNYGNNGWNDYQEYTFRLQYTAWNITIWIDDVEIVNFDGCYEPGRFGFYNSSQNFVIYSDFTYQYIADFDVINPDICVNDTGYFSVGFNDCPYSGYYPHGTTFNWDYGDGTSGEGRKQKHKFDDPKEYDVTLTVTDPLGCTDTSVHPILVSWLSVSSVDSAAICDGESKVLVATTDGAVGYKWGDGSTSESIIVDEAGAYVVEIEDSLGCKGFDTIHVDVGINPVINLGNDVHICLGDSVEIGEEIAQIKYTWSTSEETSKIVLKESGEYWVEIESKKGCKGSDTLALIISGPEINLPADVKLCSSEAPVLIESSFSDFANIVWSNGETSKDVYSSITETLIATVTDSGNCSKSDTIEIYFEANPNAVLPADTQLCMGSSLRINNTDLDFDSEWMGPGINTGYSEGFIDVIQSGEYILRLSSPLGCISEDSIRVDFFDQPTVSLGQDTTVCFSDGGSFLKTANTSETTFLWNTSATTRSIEIDATGLYTLEVENDAGCRNSSSFTVSSFCPYSIYFPNAFTPNGDGSNDYFPTPNSNLKGYQIFIYNRWGQLLFSGTDSYNAWDGTYMGLECQMDVYVWKAVWEYEKEDGELNTSTKVGHVSLIR